MAIAGYAEKNCSIARPPAFLGERWTMLIPPRRFPAGQAA
jgi:hypothetical protein